MNIVAIGAHYDDIELGCGGTMARYKELGYSTYGIVVTVPEHARLAGDSLSARQQEGLDAATILGYELVDMGKYQRAIEYTTDLVQDIEGHLDDIDPDIIITHWPHDVHQDHEVVGRCVMRAARHYPRVLLFRTNWYATLGIFNPNFYVALTDRQMDLKREATIAHRSEYARNGEGWLEFFISRNRAAGTIIGIEYAEEFEVLRWIV